MDKTNKYIKNILIRGLTVLFVIFIPNIVLAYEPEWVKNIKSAVMSGISEGFGSAISLAGDALYELLAVVASVILWLVSWFAWAAGKLLNFAIDISIIKFSELANLPFITESWKIMRDLANIAFIFILLYIAISTILRINSQDAKKMLSYVIIVALLVNFSAVFTRIAIDASNVTAIAFYNNIGPDDGSPVDISTILIQGLSTAQYFTGQVAAPSDTPPSATGILLNTIGSIILMIVFCFVVLVAAILFIIRALMLLFLIIVSPVAFLGFALPKLGNRLSGPWLKELTSNLLFAPAFMILFFITMKIADGRDELQSLGGGGFTGGIIIYIFIIGFLMASIIVAKQLGAHGGAGAEKFAFKGLKLGGAATGGFALGTTARIGQSTIGKGTKALTNTQSFKNSYLGRSRLATAGFKKISDGSFDIRKTKAVKESGVGSYLGTAVATPAERIKAKNKKEKEHAAYLASGDTNLEETKTKETEIDKKEKKKSTLNKRADNTKEEIKDLEREMSALEQNIPKLENEIRAIENQQKFETDPQKHLELQKEIDSKKTQINDTKKRIEEIPTEKSSKEQIVSNLEQEQTIIQSEIDTIQQEITQLPQSRTDKYVSRIEKSPGTTTGAKIIHYLSPIRLMAIRNTEERKKHAEDIRRYARQSSNERKKSDSEEAWQEKLEKLVRNLDKEDTKKEEKT